MIARFLLLLVSWLVVVPVPAQDAPPTGPQCRDCQNRGCLDCRLHPKDLLAMEREVLFCSVATECKSCAGALATDCKICKNPEVEKGIEERKALAKKWLDERRAKVDAPTKNPELMHLKTAHCDLTFSIPPLTVGRDKPDTHRLMHLYGKRIEELRARYCELFGVTDKEFSARLEIYLFKEPRDHKVIAPRVTGAGGGSSASQKLMGATTALSMWHDQRAMPGDEGLWRSVVHNTTHLILSNMKPEQWVGNRKYGWLDEGLAHWFEDLVTQKCTNFCYEEIAVQSGASFKGGRWRVPVRKLLESGKVHTFAELGQKNTDQLAFEEHAFVFAWIDFLIAKYGGPKLKELMLLAKKDKPARDALQEVYGLNPFAFDEQFAAWVKATYPLEEKQ